MWITAQLLVHFGFVVVVLWGRVSLCNCPEAGCCLLCGSWKSTPDSLEEQPVLLTATPVLPLSTNPALCWNYIYCSRVHAYAHTVQIWRSENSLQEVVLFTMWVLGFEQGHRVPLPAESSHCPVLFLLVLMCSSPQCGPLFIVDTVCLFMSSR